MLLNIIFFVNFLRYPWISTDIKKICGYLHNGYPHGYEYGCETDIFSAGRVRGNYYSYPIRPVDIPNLSILSFNKNIIYRKALIVN